MRIPITMCHGIRDYGENPLTVKLLRTFLSIAADLGFESINYDDLAAWRRGEKKLPDRPIMFDFDHPFKNLRYECHNALSAHGFVGNAFVYTRPYDETYDRDLPWGNDQYEHMTWEEIAELREEGWTIGAHTVSHPNLSELSLIDPTGDRIREELDRCNQVIRDNLGFMPQEFAFTGTSWSSIAEAEVKKRYRFGRLWIIGSEYKVDGQSMRYAELVKVDGLDEPDGGPPVAARYITETSDPYRLPSMELQYLLHEPSEFRAYLEGALSSN